MEKPENVPSGQTHAARADPAPGLWGVPHRKILQYTGDFKVIAGRGAGPGGGAPPPKLYGVWLRYGRKEGVASATPAFLPVGVLYPVARAAGFEAAAASHLLVDLIAMALRTRKAQASLV